MKNPAPLTDVQKRRLKIFEPALRKAVETGNVRRANALTQEIQELLRPTGHEARLMRAKTWLFEAEMEAGNIEYAISGFESVRKSGIGATTRLYLEATALLAVCYLRKGDLSKARPQIDEALASLQNIKSDTQRRKFRSNIVKTI
jgi:ATP/maltotriose-dependent transcriptional regulator MalT